MDFFATLKGMRGFADFLPPGPKVPEYDFTIIYYVPPHAGKYRDEVLARLRAGIPQSMAGAGLPVSQDAVFKIAQREGIKRKDAKYELRRIGNGTMDAWDVYNCYENKRLSAADIAKLAGCSTEKVYKVLDYMGVKDRASRRGNRKGVFRRMRKINTPTRRGQSNPHRDKAISKWKKLYGSMYLPVYEDMQRGMTGLDACKKHNVPFAGAQHHFSRMRDKYLIFLDWGKKFKFTLKVTEQRLEQWVHVAQMSHNNVLDWALATLNREADKHDNINARIKSRKHRRPALPESDSEGKADS